MFVCYKKQKLCFFNLRFTYTAFFVQHDKNPRKSPKSNKPNPKKKREDIIHNTPTLVQHEHHSCSCNAPHGIIHGHCRVHRGCTAGSTMIALYPILHHRTVLQLFIMIKHKFWYLKLNLVPPHMVPQKLNPVYVVKLPVHPVFADNPKSKLFIEPSSTLKLNTFHTNP